MRYTQRMPKLLMLNLAHMTFARAVSVSLATSVYGASADLLSSRLNLTQHYTRYVELLHIKKLPE